MPQCNGLEDHLSEILLDAFKISNSDTNGRDSIGVQGKRREIKGQDGNVRGGAASTWQGPVIDHHKISFTEGVTVIRIISSEEVH